MLVLSRKKNESIVINDDITIIVVEILGDKVRLGIEAPKEVPVHRQEVYDAIHREELCDVEVENGQNDCSQGESANHRPQNHTPNRTGGSVAPEKREPMEGGSEMN